MGTKSANGLGTIYRRKDGRFEGRGFVLATNGTRRRVSVYGTTRAEVQRRLQEMLVKSEMGVPVAVESWTVARWLDHWLETVVSVKNRPRTVELYEGVVRNHIKPHLGTRRLTQLSVSDVQTAINDMVKAGIGPNSIQKVRTVLSAALSRAVREELLLRNVARLVDMPQYERKEIRPWSVEQATRFLATARGHEWELGFLLLVLYGMRRGEVLGLRWSDIDFEQSQFRVVQQLQRINGALVTGPVKTSAGRRTLPLLPVVRDVLVQMAGRQGIDLSQGTRAYGDALVLRSSTGRGVEPGNFARTFQILTARAGLPRITVHHTRHTAATMLKHLGVPARDAQLILGHANVTTTQQLYQHGDVEAQRAALETVESTLVADRRTVRDVVADGSGCRQLTTTDASDPIDRMVSQSVRANENRHLTEVEMAAFLGGSGGTRTHDILLKRDARALLRSLPTPVLKALHSHATVLQLGRVGVKICRQTVSSQVLSDELSELRSLSREARFHQLQMMSFPYSLLPRSTTMEISR